MRHKCVRRAAKSRLSPAGLEALIKNPNRFIADHLAEEVTGIPIATLRRWRHEGRGPRYTKTGSSVRYKVAWLLDFVESRIIETRDSAQLQEAK